MASFDTFERKIHPSPEPRSSNTFEGGLRRFVIPPIDELRDRSDANCDQSATQTTAPDHPALSVITAQLATRVEQVPDGPSWLHEVELDGHRVLAHVGDGAVHLYRVRAGRVGAKLESDEDLSALLPGLAADFAMPALANSVFDGVVCALRSDGVSCGERLEQALADGRDAELVFFAFDMPFADGEDLRHALLIERKRALRQRLERHDNGGGRIRFCEHVVGAGAKVFDRACELGVEGVVSKRIDSTYQGDRSRAWQAVKCARRLSLVVGGFTAPHGSRRHFGALLVGSVDDDGRLQYRGKVGSGFCEDSLEQLRPRLDELRQDQPMFVDPPTGSQARGVNWVAPRLVVDVEYGELTHKGRLRHARFKGLHDDGVNRPSEPNHHEIQSQVLERPEVAELALVSLTEPDRPMYSARGLSKQDLADYAAQIAESILPHVCGRALTLIRCPDGVDGEHLVQDQAAPGLAEGVSAQRLEGPDGTMLGCLSICDTLGLIALIQMNALEIHISGARIDKLDHPDRLVFKLDPAEGVEFTRVVEAALDVRDRLEEVGLASFVKTGCGGGLHVVAPVQRRRSFGLVERFCRAFTERMVTAAPERYIGSGAGSGGADPRGRVAIDHRCNARGASSLAPFSPRARPDALVSTPLAWDELGAELRPEAFDVSTIPARLASLERDPWAEFFELRQWITKASFRALGLDPDA